MVTVPPLIRRQVPTALAAARRFSELGAHGQAETAIECVLAAIQKERNEPLFTARAITTGVTTSNWPLRAGRDIKMPPRINDARPAYPPDVLGAGIGGIVTFDFLIDEQGKPTNLRRLGTSMPALEQVGRAAIEQWRFAPTTVAGIAVPIAMSITFAFQAKPGVVEEVVRVGGPGEIEEPKKIKNVPPRYPAEAQASRQQGVVIIEAIIDRAGAVTDARLVRSAGDALDRAALEAVRQWEFTPTLLFGVPVSVIMTVTVNFTLR
jgi:protein TonB